MRWGKWILTAFLLLYPLPGRADDRTGALVLSFDDGYPSWIQTIAPELTKVGGKATGFVNNQRIQNHYISFEELRTLQNRYGWEIGTHTYHHHNAVEYVKRQGLESWITEELDRSTKELTAQGLKIRSLAFPFNVFDRNLSEKVKERFSSFRRWEDFPIADGKGADGSIPGCSIDLAGYIPLDLLFQWIEYAQKQNKILFLYGHEVLPEDRFFEGRVASVSSNSITAEEEILLTEQGALCLVPDKNSLRRGSSLRVRQVKDRVIELSAVDLSRRVKPGSPFIIGPCYGTPLHFFRKLMAFSASRLRFLATEEALAGGASSVIQEKKEK